MRSAAPGGQAGAAPKAKGLVLDGVDSIRARAFLQTPPPDALRARRQRQAEHLHDLGPVAVFHAVREIAAGADLDVVLARYARLDPEILRALRGDRFPAPPIHKVAV